MKPIPALDEVVRELRSEIALVTNSSPEKVDPEKSLAANGIDSMGFLEIILFVKKTWGFDLIEGGMCAADFRNVNSLASVIERAKAR